jgi:hypothetical protein
MKQQRSDRPASDNLQNGSSNVYEKAWKNNPPFRTGTSHREGATG